MTNYGTQEQQLKQELELTRAAATKEIEQIKQITAERISELEAENEYLEQMLGSARGEVQHLTRLLEEQQKAQQQQAAEAERERWQS
nr:MAG TPA_asm: hypothetical protein [Caudoviricetes sp.]